MIRNGYKVVIIRWLGDMPDNVRNLHRDAADGTVADPVNAGWADDVCIDVSAVVGVENSDGRAKPSNIHSRESGTNSRSIVRWGCFMSRLRISSGLAS